MLSKSERASAEMLVLVPRKGSVAEHMILPASGIIGVPHNDSRYLVYFEGNKHGFSNIVTFEDKLHHACDRFRQAYPTTATGLYLKSDFVVVGTWFGDRLAVTDAAVLVAWKNGCPAGVRTASLPDLEGPDAWL